MKVLKVAVSGLGRIGWQYHIPNMMKHEGFKFAAACDPVEERRKEAEQEFSVITYADFKTMIDTEKPDLAVICSPTHLHAEQAIYAMENGCDVFLEKPMARDIAEAEKIKAAYESTGRKLMMYQPHRAGAEMQRLLKIIESGVIGDIFLCKFGWYNFVHRDDWQAFKKYGGGMLNNYGAHLIDASLYLAKSKAKKISASMFCIASAGDADDVVKALIETESGIALDLEINMAAAQDLPKFAVYGQYGAIIHQMGKDGESFRVRYYEPEKQTHTHASDELAAKNRKYVTTQPSGWIVQDIKVEKSDAVFYYDECYKYFALDEKPLVSVSESMEVMRVIDECRKSAGWQQD